MRTMLIFADFDVQSGFGTVTKNLHKQLSKRFFGLQFCFYAINNVEPHSYIYDDNTIVVPSHLFAFTKDKRDAYHRNGFLKFWQEDGFPTDYFKDMPVPKKWLNMKFDYVLILQDIEVINVTLQHLRGVVEKRKLTNKIHSKTIFYFPVDSPPLGKDLAVLPFFDLVVPFTEYGKKTIKALNPDVWARIAFNTQIIGHGTDPSSYYEMSAGEKTKIRKKVWKVGKDDIVIMQVNRNQPRKDLASSLMIFAEVLKKHKKAGKTNKLIYYLHAPLMEESGIHIQRACYRLELVWGEDVRYPEGELSVSDMCKRYNAADLFFTTTCAEGWGLTIMEAMACGLPVVCPNHTSLPEVTGGHAIYMKEGHTSIFPRDAEKIRSVVGIKDGTKQLSTAVDMLMNDKETIQTMAQKGKAHVSENFTWDKVGQLFQTAIGTLK